jgi:hypothetical protein
VAELLQAWAGQSQPVEGAGLRSEGLDQAIKRSGQGMGSANSAGQQQGKRGTRLTPGETSSAVRWRGGREFVGAAARRKREMVQAKEKAAARRDEKKRGAESLK